MAVIFVVTMMSMICKIMPQNLQSNIQMSINKMVHNLIYTYIKCPNQMYTNQSYNSQQSMIFNLTNQTALSENITTKEKTMKQPSTNRILSQLKHTNLMLSVSQANIHKPCELEHRIHLDNSDIKNQPFKCQPNIHQPRDDGTTNSPPKKRLTNAKPNKQVPTNRSPPATHCNGSLSVG